MTTRMVKDCSFPIEDAEDDVTECIVADWGGGRARNQHTHCQMECISVDSIRKNNTILDLYGELSA